MKNDNRGFSFVELLVVIAIIAIISTVAITGMTYLNRTNAKKAVETVVSGMNLTRSNSTAYKTTWKCTIEMDSDKKTYLRIYSGSDDPSSPSWTLYNEYSLGHIQTVSLDVPGVANSPILNRADVSPTTLTFVFSNETGALSRITKVGGSYYDGTEESLTLGSSFATLTITTTSDNTASIKLYFVSGRVELM